VGRVRQLGFEDGRGSANGGRGVGGRPSFGVGGGGGFGRGRGLGFGRRRMSATFSWVVGACGSLGRELMLVLGGFGQSSGTL
jgi:hypothetical protein